MPCHKNQMDQGSRRPLRKKLFKKPFKLKKIFYSRKNEPMRFFSRISETKKFYLGNKKKVNQKLLSQIYCQAKGNPLMQDTTSSSSTQWGHMGLSLPPLPLLAQLTLRVLEVIKNTLKFSHQWR